MSCYKKQKAEGNTPTSGMNSGVNYDVNGVESCISPQEFDKMCNYKSDRPFANLQGPPSNSKIKVYWTRGDVRAPLKNCALTFTEYMSWQTMPKNTPLSKKTWSFNIGGNSYQGRGNGLNNPINISIGKISKQYGGNKSQKMADGQKAAVFPDMKHGLAAAMHFYVENYHGQNMCQLNNRHQGYVSLDGKEIHDCIGMAALRLRWVTNNCKQTGLKPNECLDLRDKDTLFVTVNSAAKAENGLTFDYGFLNDAYTLLPIYLKS